MRGWAQTHADLLQNYLAAYIEGQRRVMNPAHRVEMLDLLMKNFKLDSAAAAASYEALLMPGAGLAPDARLNLEGFQTVLAIRAEMVGMWGGVAPSPLKYIELSYFDMALQKTRSTSPGDLP
jgi:ABC-type nitrate/sulfonate/bicarbonate transport system substrate-binding protein